MKTLATIILLLVLPFVTSAHSGRLNSEGCHNNNKTGKYECHKASESKPAKTKVRTAARISARDYNCSNFSTQTEAQKTYKRAGGPRIDPYDLDRDRDGIACEALR